MQSTADIKVSPSMINQVIGQEEAVNIIKKAAIQRRHVLLIGEPGTGKSMLGMALAEMLPKSNLKDILSYPNHHDEHKPLIKEVAGGKGREAVKRAQLDGKQGFKNQNIFFFIILLATLITPWWYKYKYNDSIMFGALFIGGIFFLVGYLLFVNMGQRFAQTKTETPKVIVDNFDQKHAPFYDATGAHAGALLGDCLHDPFQSGGLGTPAHLRIVAGMIHKANKGVLFIDEIATLDPRTQQELLTSLQERKLPITGQSERSAGAMVISEPVPCDYILIAAGNADTVQHMHPALRSRIRGYGYEIYMKDVMKDTPENRKKVLTFVAQEIKKDNRIPHFAEDAVNAIIDEARKMANRKGHLTLRLRNLGGLIRAAGDMASEVKAPLVRRQHVEKAKTVARPLEQQMADTYIERKKEYGVIVTSGSRVGRVNGLAVMGGETSYSGILLPIEAEVTPGGDEKQIVATGKLGEIAKEAVKNVSAIIKKYFGEDIKEKHDIYVQFLQTYEGVEGDSASIAVATAIISALKDLPIKQDLAMTGSLSVRGEVLPIGGVSSKVEAAIEAGLKQVLVPKANVQDIVIKAEIIKKIKIVPVETIQEVLEKAIEWKGKETLLKKIKAQK